MSFPEGFQLRIKTFSLKTSIDGKLVFGVYTSFWTQVLGYQYNMVEKIHCPVEMGIQRLNRTVLETLPVFQGGWFRWGFL